MAKDMYVVKLGFSQYADFARWITADGGTGVRRYKLPPGQLNTAIETQLKSFRAKVHENCDRIQPTRDFGKDDNDNDWNRDNVITHRDSRSGASNQTNMAMPEDICLDAKGNIDLSYLRGYVNDIKNAPDDDAAWSLLGMYFLSRCK